MRRLDHHDPTIASGRGNAAGTPASAPGATELVDRKSDGGTFPSPPLALSVDWKLFEHHLAEEDLTEEEKREFIEALWYIIISFVDLGFGIEPVNQALRAAALDDLQPVRPVAETTVDSSSSDEDNATKTNTEESDRKERNK